MSTSSIDGLVSGLNTTQIIDQLMQLAAQPQTLLKNEVSVEQSKVAALQKVNASLASVASKAGDLSQMSSWSPSTATSSNDNVTVQAGAGSTPSTLTFSINNLATAYQASYTTTGALSGQAITAGVDYTINFNDGRSAVTINTGDGTLQSVADALNASGTNLHAALVRIGTDSSGNATYSLNVTDAETGGKSGFSISPVNSADPAFMGGVASSSNGVDSSITMAGQTTPLTSSSNTFTGLMPGVDVTLGPGATGSATITVSRDAGSLASKVQALVDAANSALDGISAQTSYNADTKTSAPLTGDSTLRDVSQQLLSAVTDGVNGKSLAAVGIQVDKTGKITFDADKFKTAYEADPAGTAAYFTGTAVWSGTGTGVALESSTWRTQPGTYSVAATASGGTIDGQAATLTGSLLTGATGSPVEGLTLKYSGTVNGTVTYTRGIAAKLEAIAQQASDSTDGTLTADIQGHNSSIADMQSSISDWDVRLQDQRTALERQYANLEVSLGKLKDQGTWLAGQIASLPSISTSSKSGS